MRARPLIGLWIGLFALASTVSKAATGYALVIASGDFMKGSPYTARALPGPHADARLMSSLLMWRFGFTPRNIGLIGVSQSEAGQIAGGLQCLSSHATFAAIQKGFAWLARVAADPKDPVVIYYAGHGKVVNNPDRMARDVDSEALVTYDADAVDSNLVKDVQIKTWLNRIGSRHKTVIMDCCFSGDMIRDVTDGEGLPGGRVIRGVGSDRSPASPLRRELELFRGPAGRESDPKGRVFEDVPAGTVLLAACGKQGRAYEKHLLAADGRPTASVGEFTWALYRVLCHNQGSLSYETLRDKVDDRLRERGLSHLFQRPVLLPASAAGDAIGPPPWSDRSLRVPIQAVSGQEAVLGVGWFSGLRTDRDLIPAGTGVPIRLSDLGWFDARAAGIRPPEHDYLTVRQFP